MELSTDQDAAVVRVHRHGVHGPLRVGAQILGQSGELVEGGVHEAGVHRAVRVDAGDPHAAGAVVLREGAADHHAVHRREILPDVFPVVVRDDAAGIEQRLDEADLPLVIGIDQVDHLVKPLLEHLVGTGHVEGRVGHHVDGGIDEQAQHRAVCPDPGVEQ